MAIDIITLILLAMAAWKGYSRGLIVAIFSLLAIIIGIAAALKFSVVVAGWLQSNTDIGAQWLPFLSFAIVLVGIIIVTRWIANMIEAAVDLVLLGWLNKAGGIILYVALYMLVFSVVLFYATQMGLIKPDTIEDSQTYALIAPWAPRIINGLGYMLPFFKDLFTELEGFFTQLADDAL